MEKIKLILFSVLVIAAVVACDNDDTVPALELDKETISAKWMIEGDVNYESFEFNQSGHYIIVRKGALKTAEKQVLFGSYTITDDGNLLLADFGTLLIKSLYDQSVNFSVLPIGETEAIGMTAKKVRTVESSDNTELLCRSWQLVAIDGESVIGTDDELTVLFSSAGTYFVEFANPSEGASGGLAQWRWKDGSEIVFLYSWEEKPVWDQEDEVEIMELSAASLKIRERFEEEGEIIDEIYELVPFNSDVASPLKTKSSNPQRMFRGLLRQ